MSKINLWKPFRGNLIFGLFFSFSLSVNSLFSQNAFDLSLQILGPSFFLDINFEQSAFLEWGRTFRTVLEKTFQKEGENRNVILFVTMSPHQPPLFEFSAKPAYSSAEEQEILAQLQRCAPPQAKWTETVILFSLKINEGNEQTDLEFLPKIDTPLEKRKQKFKKLSFEAQYQSLQNWTKTEALPVLFLYLETIAEDFEGLTNFLQKLKTVSWKESLNKDKLTTFQKSYWQSLIEMEPGNQIIPAFQIFLAVAEGKLDWATRFLAMLRYFSNPEEVPTYYLQELFWKLEMFHLNFSESLQQGRMLCLEKRYPEALQQYQKILLLYPHSAALYYERFVANQLLSEQSPSSEKESWEKTAKQIKSCDPFFASASEVKNGKEAYFLYRCTEVSDLFKDPEKLSEDFLEYANIAFDIQEYTFAVHLYWICFIYFSEEAEEQRKILCRFFYCLLQLGHTEMHKMVEGITEEDVQNEEKEREERMKRHPIYQKFQKKE